MLSFYNQIKQNNHNDIIVLNILISNVLNNDYDDKYKEEITNILNIICDNFDLNELEFENIMHIKLDKTLIDQFQSILLSKGKHKKNVFSYF